MAIAGRTGVTANTPKNIVFGAGTIHKGLKFTDGKWNMLESIVGSTNGGSKVSIIPVLTPVEVDGVLVPTKGLKRKTGENATMEVNFAEVTSDVIKAATLAADGTAVDGYEVIESKADLTDEDYWENIAFVGLTLDGEETIFVMDNALCTSGLELESKNNEGAVFKAVFECNADITSSLDKLPWRIYRPDGSVVA